MGAYNGDIGIVESINMRDRSMVVRMDDRRLLYPAENLNELEIAYAITVHKSQGSEFPAVVAAGGAGAAKALLPQPLLHRRDPRPQIVHRGRAAGCGEPDDVQCPAEPAVQRPVRIAERESAAGTDGGRITSQAPCASSPTRRGLVYTFYWLMLQYKLI